MPYARIKLGLHRELTVPIKNQCITVTTQAYFISQFIFANQCTPLYDSQVSTGQIYRYSLAYIFAAESVGVSSTTFT